MLKIITSNNVVFGTQFKNFLFQGNILFAFEIFSFWYFKSFYQLQKFRHCDVLITCVRKHFLMNPHFIYPQFLNMSWLSHWNTHLIQMIFRYLQNISLFTSKLDKVFHINIPGYIYTIASLQRQFLRRT